MPLLEIILGFAFLIFIHELGHFLVARWCGIRCPQFAVGMGQAVLAWRKGIGLRPGSTEREYTDRAIAELEKTRGPLNGPDREKLDPADVHAAADSLGLGTTEYRLNWLPIGGYVKMVGQEDTDPNAKSKDPAAFGNKSAKARAAVLVAGVVMNLITGLAFFVIAFSRGVEFPSTLVGQVAHDSPAEQAGLQVGDQITAIDGTKVTDFVDVKMRVVLAGDQTPLQVTVLRGGQILTLPITPKFDKTQGMQTLGFNPGQRLNLDLPNPAKLTPEESKIWAATPFGKIKSPTAKIISLNGQPVADYAAFYRALQTTQGQAAQIGVQTGIMGLESPGAPVVKTVILTPELDAGLFAAKDGDTIYSPIGIRPLTHIAVVVDDSAAHAAGLRENDVVLAIAGQEFPTPKEFFDAIQNGGSDGTSITVERDGKALPPITVKPRATGRLSFLGIGPKRIGVVPDYATDDARFSVDEKAKAQLNFPRGSRLMSLAGQPVANWRDIQRILTAGPAAQPLTAVVMPHIGTTPTAQITAFPISQEAARAIARAQWLPPVTTPLAPDTKTVIGDGPLDSVRIGIHKTRDAVVQTYVTIVRLIQGSVGKENINGVIGIVAGGAKVAESGNLAKFLYLLGIISINLAVMNLLPIPVLDGGHLVFLAYEKITGKPMPEKAQTVAFFIGLALLGSLMLFATWNDLVRWATH